MSNGFVYVASMSDAYYKAAVRSAISLKDNYPEANITLFTHKVFLRDEDKQFFDNIVTDIPIHKRAKMWGMAKSPYKKTLYLDCDTEIRSENISTVFDLLGKKDILFTRIIPHVARDQYIDENNKLEYHGGVILYNNKKLTVDFLNDWYDVYLEQTSVEDWSQSRFGPYSPKMRQWDQFTAWFLLNQKKYSKLKHDFFPNGGHEFNYIFLLEGLSKKNDPYRDLEQIVYHYTIPSGAIDAGHIKHQRGITGDSN